MSSGDFKAFAKQYIHGVRKEKEVEDPLLSIHGMGTKALIESMQIVACTFVAAIPCCMAIKHFAPLIHHSSAYHEQGNKAVECKPMSPHIHRNRMQSEQKVI